MARKVGRTVTPEALRTARTTPVIMVFQPDSFALAESPKQLRAWEKMAVSTFEMSPTMARAIVDTVSNGGTCCESGDTNDCDAD